MGHFLKAKYAHSSVLSDYFIFNKCPIYTHDVANAKCSTNWDKTDYSAQVSVGQEGPYIWTVYVSHMNLFPYYSNIHRQSIHHSTGCTIIRQGAHIYQSNSFLLVHRYQLYMNVQYHVDLKTILPSLFCLNKPFVFRHTVIDIIACYRKKLVNTISFICF